MTDESEPLDTLTNAEESDNELLAPPPKPKRVLSDKQKECLAAGRAKGRETLNKRSAEVADRRLDVEATKLAKKELLAEKREKEKERTQQLIIQKAQRIKDEQREKRAKLNKKEPVIESSESESESESEEEIVPPPKRVQQQVKKIEQQQPMNIPKPAPVQRNQYYTAPVRTAPQFVFF